MSRQMHAVKRNTGAYLNLLSGQQASPGLDQEAWLGQEGELRRVPTAKAQSWYAGPRGGAEKHS